MKILAIETSCDETAASVIEANSLPLTATRKNVAINNSLKADSGQRVAECRILSNVIASQINIHKKFGGVFPEHASRAHTEKILPVVESAIQQAAHRQPPNSNNINSHLLAESGQRKADSLDLVAVTVGPGLIGSLLIGVNFAKTYAYTKNLPIIGINHWLGHIYSNFTSHPVVIPVLHSVIPVLHSVIPAKAGIQVLDSKSCRQPVWNDLPKFPALILIVSGGHTGLVLMKSHTDIQPLGETLDDAAGEAFDKVAKLLGLEYPGGPAISKAAAQCHPVVIPVLHSVIPAKAGIQILDSKSCRQPVWNDNIKFPRSMLNRPDYNFSFSGLKTAVLYKVQELTKRYPLNAIRSQIAYEFEQTVIDILVGKTIQAALKFCPKSICLCGGVSANKELREQMEKAVMSFQRKLESSKITFHVPPMELTTDNAAMIGIAAAYQNKSKWTAWDKINADSNLKL